mmetsp:Transcript_33427/g.84461  ORF Transcript_33427/g.84461 Transcript_33427/m.84461 type:complete len:224 (+) Transcript_33427:1335-2006(+)
MLIVCFESHDEHIGDNHRGGKPLKVRVVRDIKEISPELVGRTLQANNRFQLHNNLARLFPLLLLGSEEGWDALRRALDAIVVVDNGTHNEVQQHKCPDDNVQHTVPGRLRKIIWNRSHANLSHIGCRCHDIHPPFSRCHLKQCQKTMVVVVERVVLAVPRSKPLSSRCTLDNSWYGLLTRHDSRRSVEAARWRECGAVEKHVLMVHAAVELSFEELSAKHRVH